MVHNLVRCLADYLRRCLFSQCVSSFVPMTLRTLSVEVCRCQSSI